MIIKDDVWLKNCTMLEVVIGAYLEWLKELESES
jgi:hypothetical protein